MCHGPRKECIFEITPAITMSFELLSDLFKLRPQREYMLWGGAGRRAVTASDAVYEVGKGSAGFVSVVDPGQPEETRLGKVIAIPGCLCNIWGEWFRWRPLVVLFSGHTPVVLFSGQCLTSNVASPSKLAGRDKQGGCPR